MNGPKVNNWFINTRRRDSNIPAENVKCNKKNSKIPAKDVKKQGELFEWPITYITLMCLILFETFKAMHIGNILIHRL